jgi:Zn-finger nucleic acid-binding protein
LLGQAEEEILCPVCGIPLMVASFDDRFEGWFCGTCKGMLLDRDTFKKMLGFRRAWADGVPEPEGTVDRADLEHQARCPQCQELMDTHPYLGPGAFVIDSCVPCDVVWLDYGEIEKAANAPGRDRGSAYRPRVQVTKPDPQSVGRGKVKIEVEISGLADTLLSAMFGD